MSLGIIKSKHFSKRRTRLRKYLSNGSCAMDPEWTMLAWQDVQIFVLEMRARFIMAPAILVAYLACAALTACPLTYL